MNNGENISTAVKIMTKFEKEIQALAKNLSEALRHEGKNAAVTFSESGAEPLLADYQTVDEWVCRGWRWSFTAKERKKGKGKRKSLGTLSVVADLWDERRPSSEIGFPCLIVAWGPWGDDWDEWLDSANDELFWPFPVEAIELRAHGRLFWYVEDESKGKDSWYAASPQDGAWFYILPITAITSVEKVKALIVNPVHRLLQKAPVDEVFKELREILCFSINGKKHKLI